MARKVIAVEEFGGCGVDVGVLRCVFLMWCVGRKEDVIDVTAFKVFYLSGRRVCVYSWNDRVESMDRSFEEVVNCIRLIFDGVLCDVRGIVICGTGLYEGMMVRMSWICDCVAGFL